MTYDENQIEAIKSLENTLLIAGAGSGKTSTIIGKISYLIENNFYQDKEILVLSFTNETVNSLKNKVDYNVDIMTFHKLALEIIKIKVNNISISSDYEMEYIIKEYLNSYAIYHKKTNILYKKILKNTEYQQLITLIKSFINIYKSNFSNINYLYSFYKKSFFLNKYYYKIILDIYLIYLRELESSSKMDFNDLIIKATELIKSNLIKTPYKFIIIDEFQDSSKIRFDLVNSIAIQNKGKVFVVGDDYQSIYRFSGCDISLFTNFGNYLPNLKIIYLNHNYRNSQSLINIANHFIMKNKKQIPKNSICHKNLIKPIKLIFYVNKNTIINKVIELIPKNILILGRNNSDKSFFNIEENDQIKFLTIHKAKGLEANNVILINLYNKINGFPSKIKNEKIISNLLSKDYILYEEERRLFYVALTRTRNFIYLLAPLNNYSIFIKEFLKNYKDYIDIIHID